MPNRWNTHSHSLTHIHMVYIVHGIYCAVVYSIGEPRCLVDFHATKWTATHCESVGVVSEKRCRCEYNINCKHMKRAFTYHSNFAHNHSLHVVWVGAR